MSKVSDANLQDILTHIGNNRFLPQIVQHFDKSMIFSTDEVLVGQWIDKKPLYQRSYYKQNVSNGTTTVESSFLTNNSVDNVISINACRKGTNGYIDSMDADNQYVSINSGNLVITMAQTGVSWNWIINILYTKTTDDPVDYVPVGGCDPQFQSATTFDQNNPTNCIIRYTSGDGEQLLDADSLLLYQKSASTPESTADYIAVNTAKYTYDLFNTITVDSSAGFMNQTPLQSIPMKIVFSKNSIATRVIYGSIPVILTT